MGERPENIAVGMLVVFAAAKVFAELFEKLHQPGIVGVILAGVLVDPAVLNLVSPSPALSDPAGIFLLFRGGLEIGPRELLQVGGVALSVASLGVVLPFALGWGAAMLLLGTPKIESIFMAAALSPLALASRLTSRPSRTCSPRGRSTMCLVLGAFGRERGGARACENL